MLGWYDIQNIKQVLDQLYSSSNNIGSYIEQIYHFQSEAGGFHFEVWKNLDSPVVEKCPNSA